MAETEIHMEQTETYRYLKLEIFIPETHLEKLETALRESDAGHIGNYDSCLSYSPVMSTWRPLENTNPYLGSVGVVSREQELKVEVTIRAEQLDAVMEAIRRVHPYEEPVVNVIPLYYTMNAGYAMTDTYRLTGRPILRRISEEQDT